MTGPKIDAIFAEEAKTLKGIFFFLPRVLAHGLVLDLLSAS
jgi:hypothetical protein